MSHKIFIFLKITHLYYKNGLKLKVFGSQYISLLIVALKQELLNHLHLSCIDDRSLLWLSCVLNHFNFLFTAKLCIL